MELKYLEDIVVVNAIESFNRTFMELKWNNSYAVQQTTCRFNRTFMELKYPIVSSRSRDSIVLIVPLWN